MMTYRDQMNLSEDVTSDSTPGRCRWARFARGLLAALLVTGIALAAPSRAGAQEADREASLQGRVTVEGTGVAGVSLSLTGIEGGARRTTTSEGNGAFRFTAVPFGEYRLAATMPELAADVRRITVDRPQVEVEVAMSVATFEDTVEVRAEGITRTATKMDVPRIETPLSTSTVSEEMMDSLATTNLAEALRFVPGVQSEPFGFEPRFTLLKVRGFDAFTTGFYLDGLQLRNPGFAVGYDLEPYGTERLEVLRGPASVLYGAGSPGGLVNLVSKRPIPYPLGEVELEVGNFDRLQAQLDVGGPLGEGGELSYRLTGVVRDSDTQVDFVADDRLFIAPALTWRPGENTSWTVIAQYQEDESRSSQALPGRGTLQPNPVGEVPVDLFTGEPDVDRYDRQQLSVASLLEHRWGRGWTVRQKVRYYEIDLDDVTIFSAALRPDDRTLDRFIFGSFGQLEGLAADHQAERVFQRGAVSHTVLAGVDYQRVDVGSRQSFGLAPPIDVFDPVYGAPVAEPPLFKDDDTQQEQLGFYLQDHVRFGDRWVVSLAGRYDLADEETESRLTGTGVETDDEELTGRVGVVYLADSGLAPYASYSESFLPTVGTAPDGSPFEPERGEQWEAGVKYQPPGGRGFVTVALFDLTRQNVLQFDPATFLQVQTGEIRSRGVEVEANAELRPGLGLIASYTGLDAEITASNVPGEMGRRPTQVPENDASLWLEQEGFPGVLPNLTAGLGVRYLGSTFGDVNNTLKVPSRTLLDLALHYDWSRYRFGLTVHNVADDDSVASCFLRGGAFCTFRAARTVRGTLTYRW